MVVKQEGRADFKVSAIIGEKLKSLREEKGLSLAQVAKEMSFSPQAISLCENSKRMPSSEMLLELVKVYSISFKEIMRIREETIIETVQIFGDEASKTIRSEYDAIMSSKYDMEPMKKVNKREDYLSLGEAGEATEEELLHAKAFVLVLRSQNGKLE